MAERRRIQTLDQAKRLGELALGVFPSALAGENAAQVEARLPRFGIRRHPVGREVQIRAVVARSAGRDPGAEDQEHHASRHDRRPGSFKINLTGRWSDFATDDKGGDPISLAAYLFGLTQPEAARRLAEMLRVR